MARLVLAGIPLAAALDLALEAGMYLLQQHELEQLRRYAPLAPSVGDYLARQAEVNAAVEQGDESDIDRFLATRARLLGSEDA